MKWKREGKAGAKGGGGRGRRKEGRKGISSKRPVIVG